MPTLGNAKIRCVEIPVTDNCAFGPLLQAGFWLAQVGADAAETTARFQVSLLSDDYFRVTRDPGVAAIYG